MSGTVPRLRRAALLVTPGATDPKKVQARSESRARAGRFWKYPCLEEKFNVVRVCVLSGEDRQQAR